MAYTILESCSLVIFMQPNLPKTPVRQGVDKSCLPTKNMRGQANSGAGEQEKKRLEEKNLRGVAGGRPREIANDPDGIVSQGKDYCAEGVWGGG